MLLSGMTYVWLPELVKLSYSAPSGWLPPLDASDHCPIQLTDSLKATPRDPESVEEYVIVAMPPTSNPKSNTRVDPLPARMVIFGHADMKAPLVDKMDFGDTFLDNGAYMFDCHFPGNAVSLGPVQVVFLQQLWALEDPIRTKASAKGRSRSTNMTNGSRDKEMEATRSV